MNPGQWSKREQILHILSGKTCENNIGFWCTEGGCFFYRSGTNCLKIDKERAYEKAIAEFGSEEELFKELV